jgi:hypothetical protein
MKRFWLILAASLGLMASALPASADLLYTLNQGGGAFATPGNYGTVKLHQVGTGATAYVTVTVTLAANEVFVGSAAGYAITWNITGAPVLSSVTITSANAANFTVQNFDTHDVTAPVYDRYKASPFTSGNCGPTTASCFMYAIDSNATGSSNAIGTPLIFDVKKSGGLLLSGFAANSNGDFFAVDIGANCHTTVKTGKTECAKTGNVASNGPPVQVPEPRTWLLFLAGLVGLPLLHRRRKLARAV